MLDQKYWISKERIEELSDEEKREFHNACADFIRYDLGINAIPGSWQIPPGEIEKKFIPRPWKEYQENPVSEKLHQEWKDTGAFMTGVAGILGRVFHRPDKKDYFLAEYDVDNAVGIREFLSWKSWKTIDVLASKTVVIQHADKPEDSLHFLAYKKDNPFVNKGSDVTKSDTNLPSFEVHCVGRVMMGPGQSTEMDTHT